MLNSHDVSYINYYFNNKLYRHVEDFNSAKDLFLKFSKITAKLVEVDKFPRDMIPELESLKRKYNCRLACNIALIACHQKASIIDKSAIEALNQEVSQSENSSNFNSLFCASFFNLHFEKNFSTALIYINKCLQLENSALAHSLKGWILQNPYDAKKSFEKALTIDSELCDAVIGLSRALQAIGKSQEAFNLLNEFILTHSVDYPFANEEFMECYLSLGLWEDAMDLANKILKNVDNFSIPARFAKVIHHICTLPISQIKDVLDDLSNSIEQSEQGNAILVARLCCDIRRLCTQNDFVLPYLKRMLEKTIQQNHHSQPCLLELGNVLLRCGNNSEALSLFERLLGSDNPDAYIGLVEAQINLGETDDCASHIQFLFEIHKDNPVVNSKILYLRAKLSSDAKHLFSEALSLHMNRSFTLSNIPDMDPSFVLSIVSELYPFVYLEVCPHLSSQSHKLNSDWTDMTLCRNSLYTLNKFLPASSETSCHLTRLSVIEENLEEARDIIIRAININPNHLESNLVLSEIELKEEHVSAAETLLEMAVAHSFDVRQDHHYNRVMAQIQSLKRDHFEASKCAHLAVNQLSSVKSQSKGKKYWLEMVLAMEVLIRVQISAGHENECHKTLKEAEKMAGEFSPLFNILGAEAAVNIQRDTAEGLILLGHIGPSDPFYLRAVSTTANIYLKFKNNKKLYIACYRKLYENHSSPTTSILYGDAYMEISEPESAHMVYKQGIKDYPKDARLCLKLGELLTASHHYGKSISYYETALKLSPNNNVRLKLINVLRGIKLYDKCIRIIDRSISEMIYVSNDLKTLFESIKLMIAKSEIFEEMGDIENAIEILLQTRTAQNDILKKVERQQPDLLLREQRVAADIIVRLGSFYWQKSNFEAAMSIFSEARTLNDAVALLKFASASRILGNHGTAREISAEVAQKYLSYRFEAEKILIQVDIDCGLYDSAIKSLLAVQKIDGEAVILLVEVLRLEGRLEETEDFLSKFEGLVSPGSTFFSQALCLKFRGEVDKALLLFNRSRTEKTLEPRALFHMIDICFQGGSLVDSKSWRQRCSTARKLLMHFGKEKYPCSEKLVAETYCAIFEENSRQNLEERIKILQKESSVVATYLLGIAYNKCGQEGKAKSVLKKLINCPWSFENREWLERGLLFLGSLFINRPNESVMLAQKCLNRNKSSVEAYELLAQAKKEMGLVEDEVGAYEMAWKSSCCCHKSVGLKLASAYLKNKKNIKAIQICHQVDMPEQCSPILQRAWEMLRS